MHRSWRSAKVSGVLSYHPPPQNSDAISEVLPTYNPHSYIATKEQNQIRSAEAAIHLIPFLLVICAIILWFFSDTEGKETGVSATSHFHNLASTALVHFIKCSIPPPPPSRTTSVDVNISRKTMKKLMEFGRKAMFYVRVLSGYEERRIRSYRLDLEKRITEAQQKKAEIRKFPEQLILSEVRQMVEEMQSVNKQLEDTETAIDEYFKPFDKQAEMIVEMKLQEEEKTMKQMMQAMKAQALIDQQDLQKNANLDIAERKQETLDDISKVQAGSR
ncbi:hypothetical protein L1987_17796 [Smallanthus sonchifolius]|uniref:Uncharacterized protein n=1 Tax=Smallanthus sonchifolius TaxID=185202 RepID=A0ACB9J0G6_9ASTR|nr:hypothetical protein L1987_17796 [Smallanthus sonchifolius]